MIMSKLKVYKMVGEDYCDDSFCVVPSDVYLKSEADELISKRDFGRELFLCMTNPRLLEAVVSQFEEYKQSGIFVPALKEAK